MAIDREKLMTALSQCAELSCIRDDELCVYYKECDWSVVKHSMACENALAALREDADEIEHLRDQVYNLTLYLQYVEKTVPTIIDSMIAQFSGMPGYAGVANGHHRD